MVTVTSNSQNDVIGLGLNLIWEDMKNSVFNSLTGSKSLLNFI